jgi:TIR domain
MPSGPGERHDFFLSRRGSVAAIAQEVADVLTEKGYKVRTQDYDIPITANFIEEMHEAVKSSRDLVVLFTRDYEQSPYTRMEFTSFEANAAQSAEHRRMVILRCEDASLAAGKVRASAVRRLRREAPPRASARDLQGGRRRAQLLA